MKKVKIKQSAKINLTLDVVGVEGKFHEIRSLVSTIDVYDTIVIKKRKDKKVTLKVKGLDVMCDTPDNNAYKTAKAFMDKFNTKGVNITLIKKILVGAGMGGSSADIAGVLKGMKKLFKITDSLIPIAEELGSDTAYMINGGFAVISGRGEKISKKHVEKPLSLIVVSGQNPISARASYKQFDKLEKEFKPCTDKAYKHLKSGEFDKFCTVAKNDLYQASKLLDDQITANKIVLEKAGAPLAVMTGSGSAVIGVFKDKKPRNRVYRKLKGIYKNQIIKAKTI